MARTAEYMVVFKEQIGGLVGFKTPEDAQKRADEHNEMMHNKDAYAISENDFGKHCYNVGVEVGFKKGVETLKKAITNANVEMPK